MRKPYAPLDSPRTSRAGFTLTEVVLALAIVATAFVAVLGLLPAGMEQSRQATNSTVVGTILEDVHSRLLGQTLKAGTASFSPAYFDAQGVFIPANATATDKARRIYRADVKILNWKSRPSGTSALRPVTVSLSWPVDDKSGQAIGAENPKTSVTYNVTALTGPDWSAIQIGFEPKVEF